MIQTEEKILTRNYTVPDAGEIDAYLRLGGYLGLQKAVQEMTPEQVIDVVTRSGLRGRGGAGFPTGKKWSMVPKTPGKKYLVCNGHEKEPGTYKDQELMEKDPHRLVEGCLIAAYAIGADTVYIFIHHEFHAAKERLEQAIAQATARGYAGRKVMGTENAVEVILHIGHEMGRGYICGEETALLEGLEGKKCMPRFKPPYPAVEGLFGKPTNVNNVETLANIPFIVSEGAEAFRRFGTEKSPGTKIISLSGPVARPGNYEFPLGVPLRRVIEEAGGINPGRKIKAIIPGGSSVPMLTAEHIDLNLDYESVKAAGSQLGTAGIILIDEAVCIVKAAVIISQFYWEESCGKCTPCREGTYWIHRTLSRIEEGEGKPGDLETIMEVCRGISGKTLCALGDTAILPIMSSIERFRGEYEHHIEKKGCPVPGLEYKALYTTIMGGG
jgi:NADH-quinone oxidoreductase subunit F